MKASVVHGIDPRAPTREGGTRVVRARLADLHALAERALEPAAMTEQHDMRIAAKRLRYSLEIAGACLGPAALAAQQAARELQTVLGGIHDCDVMRPRVEGIGSVLALLQTQRELLLRNFQGLWAEQERCGVWTDLEALL